MAIHHTSHAFPFFKYPWDPFLSPILIFSSFPPFLTCIKSHAWLPITPSCPAVHFSFMQRNHACMAVFISFTPTKPLVPISLSKFFIHHTLHARHAHFLLMPTVIATPSHHLPLLSVSSIFPLLFGSWDNESLYYISSFTYIFPSTKQKDMFHYSVNACYFFHFVYII